MKTIARFIVLTGAIAALAACDSTSSVGLADLQKDSAAMAAKYLDANGNLLPGVNATLWADVPIAGTATYNGYVAGELPSGDLIGQLEMTVGFATDDLSGFADNFQHENDGSYDGALALTGVLNRGAAPNIPQIAGTLSGTLTNNATDYATAIALDGDMIGTDYDAVGGYADGTVGAAVFEGIFVAER